MVTITEHCAGLVPLIRATSPSGEGERDLLRWSIDVTMSVLGVSRSEALAYVRSVTRR